MRTDGLRLLVVFFLLFRVLHQIVILQRRQRRDGRQRSDERRRRRRRAPVVLVFAVVSAGRFDVGKRKQRILDAIGLIRLLLKLLLTLRTMLMVLVPPMNRFLRLLVLHQRRRLFVRGLFLRLLHALPLFAARWRRGGGSGAATQIQSAALGDLQNGQFQNG